LITRFSNPPIYGEDNLLGRGHFGKKSLNRKGSKVLKFPDFYLIHQDKPA
jgi:hypothetical protein